MQFSIKAVVKQTVTGPVGRQDSRNPDCILPESLGRICRAGLEKTILYKMIRSSLILGTSNFRHFSSL